ncbi:putative methyltransferase [Capsicum baccatum]|uniref:Methyltransferase n=1 Tax=Capsicum baccatum TaxID=33114 RepID=A0A2G2XTV7_CAPBA|nr:putative methyltransferase [Capsicum baccatum]
MRLPLTAIDMDDESPPGKTEAQRDRAAWLMKPKDSLLDTVAENLLDRLEDCKKTFPTALCMGGSLEAIRRLLCGRGGIEKLIMMDTSWDMVKLCKDAEQKIPNDNIETSYIIGDEEYLPVKENSVDLVISCLGLHWTNDLPGAMIQCRLSLKPDGLFLAAILGGETLKELRIACTIAQMEREGGISPRLSPLAQVRDAGNLLTRAGFTLPGVDVDEYTVRYSSALELIEHLRAMGETSALLQRSKVLKKDTALATAGIYESMFAAEDGTIPATFQAKWRGDDPVHTYSVGVGEGGTTWPYLRVLTPALLKGRFEPPTLAHQGKQAYR